MPVSLRAWRGAHGLSQRRLAATLGVTAAAISNWERGATVPSPAHRMALAAVVGCGPDDLVIADPTIPGARPKPVPVPGAGERFGAYAQRCRTAARVSLYGLSRRVRLASVEIQAIEAGEQPPPGGERLRRWAEALGIAPAVLTERAVAWASGDLLASGGHAGAARPEASRCLTSSACSVCCSCRPSE